MGKGKNFKGALALSLMLILPEFGCVTPLSTNIQPTPNVSAGTDTSVNTPVSPMPVITPTPAPQQPVDAPPVTDTPTQPTANITINGLNVLQGRTGSELILKGANFISGKAKSIVFVNDAGHATTASIKNVSEGEIIFSVPDNTETGANINSNTEQKYHNSKIYVVLDNGERVLIGDFRTIIEVFQSYTGGGGSNNNSSGNGNVIVDVDPNAPQDAGTVAGLVKDVETEAPLSDANVSLFELDDNSTFTVLSHSGAVATVKTKADGSFSMTAKIGSKYYLKVEKDGFVNFYYQDIKVNKNEINTLGEAMHLSKQDKGKAEIKGKLKDASTDAVLEGSILKVYNKKGLLINTGISVGGGAYDFDVPAGNDHFIEVVKTGYAPFRYYGFNVVRSVITTMEDIYQSLENVNRKTITGKLKDVESDTFIDGSVIKIYKNKKLISTGLANSQGTYSFLIPEYADVVYHLSVLRNLYTTFVYYGLDLSGDVVGIEDLYMTLASAGTGKIKGNLTAATASEINGSFVRIYNNAGRLIMTGLASGGAYDFAVPAGTNYWFEILRPGYTAFRYYNLGIAKDIDNSIETIYLALASLGTTTVSGTLQNTEKQAIANGLVRIYNSAGQLIMTYLANASGTYNFAVPVGTDYYMRVLHNLYSDFYYYGISLVLNTPYAVEAFYLSPASLGTGTLKGSVDVSTMPVGTVLRIYNKAGLLIMTTRVGAGGAYNFFAPVGTDYYFRVIRAGYTDFYYYGVNVLLNQIYTISEAFRLYLASAGTGTFSGVYLDAVTNQPVANTIVRIYSGNYVIASGLTDANGYYYITVPAGVSYSYRYWYYTGGLYRYYYTYTGLYIYSGRTYYSQPIYYISPELQGEGNVSGSLVNGVTGERVKGLTLKLRAGVNAQDGDILATKISGDKGFYNFDNLAAGNYTIEVSGTGYATTYYTVLALGGRTISDQNIIVTQTLQQGQTRVVLYWSSSPSDLDLHLTGPNGGDRFHLYYDSKGDDDAAPFATLDRDTFGGYGPEVITIHNQQQGTYRFSVHNFTDQSASLANKSHRLSYSYARVYVYQSSGFVNSFYVPYNPDGGNLWTVFEMNGNTITPVNTVDYINSGMSIQSASQKGGSDAAIIKSLPRSKR